MAVRKIVEIDEERCNGCGLCIPACHEGAIEIIDGKAKLVSDIYCDGLGDCLGHCPEGAINIVEREADEFDEEAVKERLEKMEEEDEGIGCSGGCPGSIALNFLENDKEDEKSKVEEERVEVKSELKQWPVQINLVPVNAPYFDNASLLICADCVPFAYPMLHSDLMKNKIVLIGCPKLDDASHYVSKLSEIFKTNSIKDITVARMEVPCCGSLGTIVEKALELAGKEDMPVQTVVTGIKGEKSMS